jgi:uncharacterized protein
MKYALLLMIRLYWKIIPESKRRACIFRKSCSKHVFETTKDKGIKEGLKALRFRVGNCRGGFDITFDPASGKKQMILRSGTAVKEEDIAQRLI